MKSLAALFAVIAVTHLAYDPLSMIVGSPQEWFYIALALAAFIQERANAER